ncbi:response regulator [Rhodobacteraceae bacterium 63075]|nr:response regulator [Rhodobacteraceae bacterium 63075]
MQDDLKDVERRLAAFERRQSFAGQLEAYALSRLNHVLFRQLFNLALVAALFLTGHFAASLGALGLLMLGELVDCGYLSTVPRRIARGKDDLGKLYRRTAITAGLQALTAAVSGLIPIVVSSAPGAVITSVAYVSCISINAGLLVHHHRLATQARLAMLLATAAIIVFIQTGRGGFADENMLFNTVGMILMFSLVYSFISFALRGYLSQISRSRDLLQRSKALARANEELAFRQEEIRRLALVARNASDSIFMADADGKILWVNEAFTEMTGYPPDEAIGTTPAELLDSEQTDPEVSEQIISSVRKGIPLRTEILNRRKDGKEIWVETNQVPVCRADGSVEFVIAIERDITDARRHAEELAAAKRAAEKGERAKAQFLATMSHEIRTPMNGIIGMAELLRDAQLPKEHASYVETIRYSAEALMRIINDILDFSKLDAGKSVICAVDFDLLACVEGALSILRPKAVENGIYLDLDCAGPLPERLHGDDGRIRQILINIVGNAIKFTHKGGVTLRLSSEPRQDGALLTFEVIDTGIGIAPDRLSTIFDEFNQADGEVTRKYGGTGLGLTISRILAREMGGDITIRSTEGEGSHFTITLPLGNAAQPEAAPPVPGAEDAPEERPIRLDGVKALVADDNKTNRLVIRRYLGETGLDIVYARDGREAVKLTRRHTPRIVFMDMSMPEMDGLTATRQIRADSALEQPTIVALTANSFASDKAACLSAGMDGFLTKPFKRGELLDWLSQL